MLMAFFSIGLTIVEYASTRLNANTIFVWTPIVLALDIGAVLQVFILVLERDGERLPVWNKFMTWVHWRTGRQVYAINLPPIPSDEGEVVAEPSIEVKEIRGIVSINVLLITSVLCLVTLLILQFVGLIYAGIGLNHALYESMQESWCSPIFQVAKKVYDSSWLGYGNTLDAPAENVTFFNVGLLNSRLSALQDRVNQLEKELAEAKTQK